jgi:hypothetical protein
MKRPLILVALSILLSGIIRAEMKDQTPPPIAFSLESVSVGPDIIGSSAGPRAFSAGIVSWSVVDEFAQSCFLVEPLSGTLALPQWGISCHVTPLRHILSLFEIRQSDI